jgi:[acyl-carrier-protein] S-malonyltransferase
MEKAAQSQSGTMASVMGLGQEACEQIAKESGAELANLNSPDQFVLSGSVEAIDRACIIAEQKGAKRAMKLKVGGAFHSSLMKSAEQSLEQALRGTRINVPSCMFIPNASAQAVQNPDEIRKLLARQLTSPVRWIETMKRASESGIVNYLEIGPGKVLKGLAKKCQPSLNVFPCGTVLDLQKLDESLKNLQKL